ncbi:GPI ethanolamine phosphate transferase 2 [Daktulosphaira vitifoliae]|uniref:GPI ethanolamine phosphate transferase 2 n=1 Tax=Daktulosphaira vitifoliae TaxID=58002 RepID=UPI0021A99513|nr:GPI ethanolamine phosphate transferase 2 [Daktulosphaira vitifoliae]
MWLIKESILFLYLMICMFFSNFLFLYGFFSFDYNDNVKSSMDDIPSTIQPSPDDNYWRFDSQRLYHKSVNKVVLMIIDGIRFDFLTDTQYNKFMPFVTTHIKNNQSCLFRTRVSAPTVTMPRIKALTTGTIPNFIDIALNLGSSEIKQDSIINQAQLANKKIIFFGDETWLKLFPKSFDRYDSTTSFYISDYTEVDNNITRHLDKELKHSTDWDIMILHYLGLDHIGHLAGPRSPLMPHKLLEMDKIINFIIDNLDSGNSELPTVLIVCGDHGMRDNGGHGGSSLGEVLVPVFFSVQNRKCGGLIDEEIMQIDIVPSISVIMGLPIPSGNIGKLINRAVQFLNINEILFAYHYNAQQVYKNYINRSGSLKTDFILAYNKANLNYYKWLKGELKSDDEAKYTINLYNFALNGMRNYLIGSVSKYDVCLLIISMILISQIWLLLIDMQPKRINYIHIKYLVFFLLIRWITCTSLHCESILCEFSIKLNTLAITIFTIFIFNFGSFYQLHSIKLNIVKSNINNNDLYVISGMLIHFLSLFSSSYIEEEHQLLYHLWTGFSTIQIYNYFNKNSYVDMIKWLFCMILHRFCKDLNYVGNQWSNSYSLGDWLREPTNKLFLSVFMILGLISILIICVYIHVFFLNNKRNIHEIFSCILYIWISFCNYVYRVNTEEISEPYGYSILKLMFSLSSWTIAWYLLVINHFVLIFMQSEKNCQKWKHLNWSFIILLLLRVSLLSRPHNLLIPFILVYTCDLIRNKMYSLTTITILHYWLSLLFFFYQGNSNSIGTIDIVPGYIGQTSYNPIVAGIHIYTHTFGLYLIVYFFFILEYKFLGLQKLCVLSIAQTFLYDVVILFFRNHLFIWSVFSPKLLYMVSYSSTLCLFSVISVFLMNLFAKNIDDKRLNKFQL